MRDLIGNVINIENNNNNNNNIDNTNNNNNLAHLDECKTASDAKFAKREYESVLEYVSQQPGNFSMLKQCQAKKCTQKGQTCKIQQCDKNYNDITDHISRSLSYRNVDGEGVGADQKK